MILASDSTLHPSVSGEKDVGALLRLYSGFLIGGSLLLTAFQVQAQAADALPEQPAAEVAQTAAPKADEVDAADVAAADEADFDTVVVRAPKRIENLQEVPQSISVVEGEELNRLIATDIGAITQRGSNISWNMGNSRTSSISIRGIGRQAQTDAMDPSVGIIVDDLAYAYNPLSSFDFTDIEAVEVTRGPQGTLQGKNATLGILNIKTRRPTFTPEAEYSVALGQNDRVIGRAAGGGPILANLLAWRGTVSVDKGDGDYPNKYNPDHTFRNKDKVSGRLQFLLTPTENFDALVKLELQPRNTEYYNGWLFYSPTPTTYANGQTNTLSTDASTRLARRWFKQDSSYSYERDYLSKTNVNLDAQAPLVTKSSGATAVLNWRVANHTLTSVTGYKDYDFQARNDEGTPFDISKNGGGNVTYEQASQELRLSSKPGGFVDYQTGVYFLSTSNDYDSGSGFGSDAGAWFASNAQYTLLDKNSNGRYLLENSLNGLNQKPLQQIRNDTSAIFGQASWHLSEPLTVTTGIRFTKENRRNTVSKLVYNNGYGAELNPVEVNGVQLGGFASNGAGVLGTNSAEQLALADSVAQKYFGVTSYAALTDDQKAQVGAAKALRQAQIGPLWNEVSSEKFDKVQPTYIFSPSYKLNENLTTYVSYQYGEKAGIAQVTNGTSNLAKAEKNTSYELGFKSLLLNDTLVLNAAIFNTEIEDYQQAVFVVDEYTTAQNRITNPNAEVVYVSATGNVPKVRARGVEVDGVYSGIKDINLRFSLAYNDAIYKKFPNLGQPLENGNLAARFRDVSGQNLPGAAKWTGNLGIDYRTPVLTDKEFHTSLNYAFSSRFNSDVTLSSYGWTPAYGIADLAIGFGTRDGKFDASITAKNLFDDDTSQVRTWNTEVPAVQRWVGIVFTSRL